MSAATCKHAAAGTPHAKRPVVERGQCASCLQAQKRRQRRSGRLGAVRRAYGLSEVDLGALMAAQRGRCFGCRRRVAVVKNPPIDHDHRLERAGWPKRATVRGILCTNCNRFLGHIGDDPAALLRLARYLIDPPAPKVLAQLDATCPDP